MKKCLVLLSTYNGEKYLKELLNSVLNQEGVYIDILIRDDGSTDNTINIIQSYNDSRIKLYTGENLKPAKSFLDLIHTADLSYDFYALCDQDDFWKPNKLRVAVDILEGEIKPALYSSAVEIVDKNLNYISTSFHSNDFNDGLYDMLMFGTPGCTFVFNDTLMKELKKYKPQYISMHDSWISFVCYAVNGKFYSDKDPHILYRQHESNVLGSTKRRDFKTLMKIIRNKDVIRSDMAGEVIKGFSKEMDTEIRKEFDIFANYKHKLSYKIKLLFLRYKKKTSSIKAFYKIKLRVLFNTL